VLGGILIFSSSFCGVTQNISASHPAQVNGSVLQPSPQSNWVYRYANDSSGKPIRGQWFAIQQHPDNPLDRVPVQRTAHQAVYHAKTRTVFIHGGNSGSVQAPVATAGASSAGADGSGATTPGTPPESADGGAAQAQPSQPASDSEASGSTMSVTPRGERLDDLWSMELRRCVVTLLVMPC